MAEVADEVMPAATARRGLGISSPLEVIRAGLGALKTESTTFDVTTTAGDKAARAFRLKCVTLRTDVDRAYEAENRPLLEAQRAARELRDEIKAAVAAFEQPVRLLIEAEESRKAAEKKRKADAEAERVASIREDISAIARIAVRAVGRPSAEIEAKIKLVVAIEIGDRFAEFIEEARTTHADTLAKLRDLHAAAVGAEEAAAKLAADMADLERLRQEDAGRRRIEDERIAQQRIEQERLDSDAAERRRAADAEADRVRLEADRVAREEREAEDRRLAEARAEIQRRQDEQDREAREQREAEELEAGRRREAAAAALDRLHGAAEQMLDALRLWRTVDSARMSRNTDGYKQAAAAREAAIAEATGEAIS